MGDEKLHEVETTDLHKGNVVISWNKPTPLWVIWIFRTEFVLSKAALIWLSSTNLVRIEDVKECVLILTTVDFITWTMGKFIGISKEIVKLKNND